MKRAHHCDGVGGQQLLRGHGGEVGDVGQGVDQGHQGDGDVDGPGKVPAGGATRWLCQSAFLELRCIRPASLGDILEWVAKAGRNWADDALARLHHLLRHVVEEVPAAVGK